MAKIPPALLDRMELIQIPGYTQEEKAVIAKRHLMPKQLREHGLTAEQLQIPDDTMKLINKKKMVNDSLPEKASHEASTLAHPPEMPIVIDDLAVEDILGPPLFESEVSQRLSQPGVAVGLAWTPMGGEIMFVEASKMEGEGKLTLTGQLGDVMKESANLALNWVRTHASKLQLGNGDLLNHNDIHIHFPAGAVGKDGPSAGVTIVTVLVSLFSDHCVRSDTAMTGEITLRGLVLPVSRQCY
ncbi:hypothetical protein KUTeg_019679 [Tegillarca granosa]|uniref:Lon proteolytic domain-containing protein n=1 Tax=Tegillarca granosa TaxID=220873 RepID=A0ABQ9EJ88_TEGGR|nr:hypothetical protein KUTeg_019679 [Tegillarca granosa]